MPSSVAQALSRRVKRSPEPGEVAITLAAQPNQIGDVPAQQTTARTLKGAAAKRRSKLGAGDTSRALLADNRDRLAGYEDYRRLDANIPEAGAALDVIAASATGGEPGNEIQGFDAEFSAEMAPDDKEFAEALIERAGLKDFPLPMARELPRMGDVFFHVLADRAGRILKLKPLEPGLIFTIQDDYGEVIGWKYFGYASEESYLQLWEVIHVKHLAELGALYGRSIFASGLRPTGFSLQAIRDATTVQVARNASGQVAMIFGVQHNMPEEERLERLEQMYELTARAPVMVDGKLDRRVIENMNEQPLILFYDVFPDGKQSEPKIQELSPTNFDGLVGVLEHWQDLFIVPLKVPKSAIGIERSGEGIGGNRLAIQDVQFARYLNIIQQYVIAFAMQVLVLGFWLAGRALQRDMVKFVMPDLGTLDLKLRYEIRKLAMEAAKIADDLGLPREFIWGEIIWDGDLKAAEEAAERYGVKFGDLDEPGATVDTPEEPEEPNAERVEEARRRVAKHLSSDLQLIASALRLVKGVSASNPAVP